MRSPFLLEILAVVVACGLSPGCFGDITEPAAEGPAATADDGSPGDVTRDAGASEPVSDAAHSDDADIEARAAVCQRWQADRGDRSEGQWTGNLDTCAPGDLTGGARDRATRLVNLYRWLADLPAVSHEQSRNDKAQACALIQHAGGGLTHSPDPGAPCYSADGAAGAGKSNIATTGAVRSVDLYMVDPGNADTLGHRRWILSNGLDPIGFGATSAYSCMWVINGGLGGGPAYTAWPAPGPFPVQAIAPDGSIDSTGWSIQSNSLDLEAADVTITANGEALPVTVSKLKRNYGSKYAIAIRPQGWSSEAGTTYHVQVTGVAEPFDYDVEIIDCAGP